MSAAERKGMWRAVADATKEADVLRSVDEIVRLTGRIDVIVNMAGKRFMNESMPYVEACHHMYGGEYGQGPGPGENIPAWLVFDQQYVDKRLRVFSRLHTAAEFEGTGAGLAIVARIVPTSCCVSTAGRSSTRRPYGAIRSYSTWTRAGFSLCSARRRARRTSC